MEKSWKRGACRHVVFFWRARCRAPKKGGGGGFFGKKAEGEGCFFTLNFPPSRSKTRCFFEVWQTVNVSALAFAAVRPLGNAAVLTLDGSAPEQVAKELRTAHA